MLSTDYVGKVLTWMILIRCFQDKLLKTSGKVFNRGVKLRMIGYDANREVIF